jgi:hypothetical protein
MVSRLVFFFFGFITSFLPAEPDSSIKAGVAVPKRAPLNATPESKSPAHGGRDPTYGVEDGGQGQFCYDCAWLSLTALSTVTCNLWL